MNTKHTPGPWRLGDDSTQVVTDALIIAETVPMYGAYRAEREANARRIVACVNALEGVTTEDLESGAFKAEIAATRIRKRWAKRNCIPILRPITRRRACEGVKTKRRRVCGAFRRAPRQFLERKLSRARGEMLYRDAKGLH
jgi:Arc/MetJ family transcription regulator